MTEEVNAAQFDLSEEEVENVEEVESNTGSASVEDASEEDAQTESEQEAEPEEDNIQKRINKITAEKYAAKREAEELRKQLEGLQSKPKETGKKPELEDFDYDENAYQEALIEHRVQKALEDRERVRAESDQQAKAQETGAAFNSRVEKLGRKDFWDVAAAVPVLDPQIAQALMQVDDGAQLIYHLGTHLDQADRLATLPPSQALLEIGRMSASLTKKQVKLSAAPDPIEPINSGGSLAKERGPADATFE